VDAVGVGITVELSSTLGSGRSAGVGGVGTIVPTRGASAARTSLRP